jgi:MoaA/NifB/PqqE/SkfB family radical SAM enzyme
VYGSNSKIHDGITKIPGSFKKTMSAIKRSKDLGILTRANVIIMQKNFTDAQNIHDLLKSENIAYSYDISLFKSPNSTTLQLLNETDIKNVFKTLGVNTSVRGADEYICNAGRGDLSINPYGNIYPCHMFKEHLGNIKTDSILDIYRESEPAKNM